MKFKIIISLMVALTGAVLLSDAFKKTMGATAFNPTYIKFIIPPGWPKPPTDIYKNNPLTEEGFQLGRKLFYDGKLSKDGNFPCASCHQQFSAFSTYDHQLSHGFDNAFTYRNSPALFNLAWMKELHWDGAINHLEVQPLGPITNKVEMAETIGDVINKLTADTSYKRMFKAAFGDYTINSQRMLKALAQFTGTIISYNSKYDQVKRGEARFSVSEEKGYATFKANCNGCHKEPLFTDNSFRNNGQPVDTFFKDYGRMRITGNPADSLKFKVPSLRNVEYSLPYMHDGRRFSLSSVVEHYRTGIILNQPTLDTLLKNRIAISNQEKVDLVQFLRALSDTAFLHNKRFGQPG